MRGTGGGPRRAAPTRAHLGLLAAQVGYAHLVDPLWYLLAPIFLIYSIKILREVSAHLELCRIGGLT